MRFDAIAAQLTFCTVRLHQEATDGAVYTGTGFMFNARPPDADEKLVPGRWPMLVTNRHLLEETSKLAIEFHRAQPDANAPMLGTMQTVILEGDPLVKFWPHPNHEVDVAVIPIGSRIDQLRLSLDPPMDWLVIGCRNEESAF